MRTFNKQLYLRLLGIALLLVGVLGRAEQADARLDPFYVVHGAAHGKVVPRILFVLDNSGSMAMDVTYKPGATYPNTKCWWDNCEDSGAGVLQSRVHAARKVIRDLALANAGTAEFALMTFGTAAPPAAETELPLPCESLDDGNFYRFTWVETVNQPYSTQWKPAKNAFGTQGFWLLCGDNRPFPYLRHDDLGGFSLPNNSADPLPDQPLYVTHSDVTAYTDPANYSRKVQWFPRFLGRRVNLDCSDPAQNAIAEDSWGDFANTLAGKSSEVCGHDYYYWPYVDGNPGYSFYEGWSVDNMSHQECDDNENCSMQTDQTHRLGVTRRNQWVGTSLYAPFYSKEILEDPDVDLRDKGPMSPEDAAMMFEGVLDEAYAGGADVTGGTPMAVAMGVVEYMVLITPEGDVIGPKPAMTQSNAPFSQPTIASYLSFMRLAEQDELCRPLSMIVVTDGQPDPWANQGGSKLYERLRSVRRILGVKTYMVAFTQEVYNDPLHFERIHEIACAATGADSTTSPCLGGNTFSDWDTCKNPADPANDCAWLAEDHDQLNATLTEIVQQSLDTDVPGGTPTVANDFQLSDPNDPESSQAAVQTSISAWTEYPEFVGHVARGACTDEDPDNPGQLADYCKNAATIPIETEELESFGPCPIGRVWDAGECLAQTDWTERRLYTHDANNNVFRVAAPDGQATPEFTAVVEELDSQGQINPPLSADATVRAQEIQAMAEWLLGRNMPDDWKLPGLPNSAPILIRRVPKHDVNMLPTVGIRDPHCAGRRNTAGDNVPSSLQSFAASAWQVTSGGGLADHYDYTEAVLVGDDFGVLHGFHYDSGNELFGFVPRALLNNARVLSLNGVDGFGQPKILSQHVYGIASTVNAGWAYDEDSGEWRHLAVFGLGPGGSEILTLDVSHMGRVQDDDPIEVVWTASTTAIADQYQATLGETWSRPALTYAVQNHEMSIEPKAYMVFGSGYREGWGDVERGRTVWMVDAITGETVTDRAYMPVPPAGTYYDVEDDLAAVSDIAVGSHCLSRYWGEMQEAYWGDPAGRLYRWDLATDATDVTSFPHVADSGGTWLTNPDDFSVAVEAFRFPACQGLDEFSCSVNPIGIGDSKGDVFTFSPAVVANNRIDQINDPGDILPTEQRDQFLIALASGSPSDNVIDGSDEDNDFHSSIYLLTDDHRADASGGFDIPGVGEATPPGVHSHFMRLPLSQIERTRTIVYPNADTEVETRTFSKATRPLRPPMIRVTGLAAGDQQADAEVFYVTYTVYEPGTASCNSNWYDSDTGEWVADPGATYEITFRLVVEGTDPFDFNNGYTLPGDYGDGFGTGGGLSGPRVEQVVCEGENCGAVLPAPKTSPCDPNADIPPVTGAVSVQTGWSELDGFTPLESVL